MLAATTTCHFNVRESDALFWSPWALAHMWYMHASMYPYTCRHTDTHTDTDTSMHIPTYTNTIKIFVKYKIWGHQEDQGSFRRPPAANTVKGLLPQGPIW